MVKLIDILGNSFLWAIKDNQEYRKIRNRELIPLYAIKKISKDNPALRARCLYSLLNLSFPRESEIFEIMSKKGKAQALVAMEKLILENY